MTRVAHYKCLSRTQIAASIFSDPRAASLASHLLLHSLSLTPVSHSVRLLISVQHFKHFQFPGSLIGTIEAAYSSIHFAPLLWERVSLPLLELSQDGDLSGAAIHSRERVIKSSLTSFHVTLHVTDESRVCYSSCSYSSVFFWVYMQEASK